MCLMLDGPSGSHENPSKLEFNPDVFFKKKTSIRQNASRKVWGYASQSTGSSRVNQLGFQKLPTQAMALVHYFVLRKSWDIPSGNLSHNYGKSPCFMGNSLEMVIFHSDVTNYQRLDGSSGNSPDQNPEKSPFFQHGRGTQIPLPRGHEVNHPERDHRQGKMCVIYDVIIYWKYILIWNLWTSIHIYIWYMCDEWTFGVYIYIIHIYTLFTRNKNCI